MREQIEGLMERVEIEMTSNSTDDVSIRKVMTFTFFQSAARGMLF